MFSQRMRGDDLAVFVLAANRDGARASQDAVRRVAVGSRNELRRMIRTRFASGGAVFNARGFAKAINVKKQSDEWWSVVDRSIYKKKRSEAVSLAWVFDNAPRIASRSGGWVAVPIKGQAPLAANGRRYAWPSEAAARGWRLEIVPIMGKPFKLIMGRQGNRGPWTPLYFYIPPYKAAKRLDLDALWRKWTDRLETEWGDAFDRRQAKRRRAA